MEYQDSLNNEFAPDPNGIYLQYCINCSEHAWCTKHNEQKYSDMATHLINQIERQIGTDIPIYSNVIPPRLKWFVSTRQFPRLGAFQVYYGDKIIFSKIKRNHWPNISKVVRKLSTVLRYLNQGRELDAEQILEADNTVVSDTARDIRRGDVHNYTPPKVPQYLNRGLSSRKKKYSSNNKYQGGVTDDNTEQQSASYGRRKDYETGLTSGDQIVYSSGGGEQDSFSDVKQKKNPISYDAQKRNQPLARTDHKFPQVRRQTSSALNNDDDDDEQYKTSSSPDIAKVGHTIDNPYRPYKRNPVYSRKPQQEYFGTGVKKGAKPYHSYYSSNSTGYGGDGRQILGQKYTKPMTMSNFMNQEGMQEESKPKSGLKEPMAIPQPPSYSAYKPPTQRLNNFYQQRRLPDLLHKKQQHTTSPPPPTTMTGLPVRRVINLKNINAKKIKKKRLAAQTAGYNSRPNYSANPYLESDNNNVQDASSKRLSQSAMSDNSLSYNKDKIPIHKTYDITLTLNKIAHKKITFQNISKRPQTFKIISSDSDFLQIRQQIIQLSSGASTRLHLRFEAVEKQGNNQYIIFIGKNGDPWENILLNVTYQFTQVLQQPKGAIYINNQGSSYYTGGRAEYDDNTSTSENRQNDLFPIAEASTSVVGENIGGK